jgi:ribosomal protein S18 acetylase RimI-like enzyme
LFSGELIDFATIKINKKSKSAILLDIMIKRDYQNKGIDRDALHKIEEYLRKKDMQTIILESGTKNEKAHHFFEKNGYTECL